MTTDKCARCGNEMQGMKISSGAGWICQRCYYITNPWQECATFIEVLHDDSQVTVREVVNALVPDNIKSAIRDEYNRRMKMRYELTCSQLGITDEDRSK